MYHLDLQSDMKKWRNSKRWTATQARHGMPHAGGEERHALCVSVKFSSGNHLRVWSVRRALTSATRSVTAYYITHGDQELQLNTLQNVYTNAAD